MWKNPLQPSAGRVSEKSAKEKSGLSDLFLHQNASLVVELTLVPVGAVEHVGLACR